MKRNEHRRIDSDAHSFMLVRSLVLPVPPPLLCTSSSRGSISINRRTVRMKYSLFFAAVRIPASFHSISSIFALIITFIALYRCAGNELCALRGVYLMRRKSPFLGKSPSSIIHMHRIHPASVPASAACKGCVLWPYAAGAGNDLYQMIILYYPTHLCNRSML